MAEEQQNTTAPVLEKKNTSFKGDVFRLVGGTVIAQIIGIITIPIISRFFGPEAYGTAALFTAITSVLAVVACWRYELAIVIPEKDEEAASVFFVSLFATVVTTLLVSLLTAFWAESIFKLLKSEVLLPYKWFIPLFVFLQGLYMTFNYWNSRTKRFNRVAAAGIINSTTTRVINIITGFLGHASGGAMVKALTAGQAAASGIIGTQIIKNDSSFLKTNFNFREILASIKRYKKFPLISTWSAFLNTLSANLPAMLLTYYFSSTAAGLFAFGHRLLTYPLSIIGSSMSQVFFQRSSEALHENKLNKLTEKVFIQLITLGLYPTLLLMIVAPEIFGVVFGNKWIEAGVFSQILAPWIFFNFICSPLTTISELFNKQEIGLCFNALLIATRYFSLFIGGLLKQIYLGLVIYSLTGAITYIIWSAVLLKLACASRRIIFKNSVNELCKVLLFLIPVLLLKSSIYNSLVVILSTTGFVTFLYYLYQIKNNAEIHSLVLNKIKK